MQVYLPTPNNVYSQINVPMITSEKLRTLET